MTARLIATIAAAQVFAQVGAFAFPALLPTIISEWHLTYAEAGWLSGIFFGAYAASVPVLVTLTDRIDPKRIYMLAVTVSTLSHFGMVFLADGFWSAFAFRVLAGVGWAGTYMVGLKALADLVEGPAQSRAVSIHAASIGVGGSLSFLIAGLIGASFDWRWAFVVGAAGTIVAFFTVFLALPKRPPSAAVKAAQPRLLDFRPVFRNRSAMAFAIGYFAHTWEMFTVRSWVVVYLTFTLARDGGSAWVLPTVAVMVMEMIGIVTSVGGNEMAIRFGRRRWILLIMGLCMALALVVGFSAHWGYAAAVGAFLLYNALIYADSAALTAGTVGSAEPARRGATMAVHATFGYFGGAVGPIVMGLLMGVPGDESVTDWGLAFGHLAVIMAVGPLALLLLKPKDLPGDRPT